NHVLADYWIKFFDFQFFRSSTLVLVCSVEVTSASTGNQTNQITHDVAPLYLKATSAQLGQNCINTALVNYAHAFGRNAQTYKAVLGLNPETMVLQVWQETTAGFVHGVGNLVSRNRTLTGYLTNS